MEVLTDLKIFCTACVLCFWQTYVDDEFHESLLNPLLYRFLPDYVKGGGEVKVIAAIPAY